MIETAWKFENESIEKTDQLQLLIWEEGISVLFFSKEGELAKCLTYLLSDSWNLEDARLILEQSGAFDQANKVEKIWMTAPKHLIIPENLYEEGYANQWIRRFHFLNAEESLFSIPLKPQLDAFVIFPIPERWQLMLKDNFKNALFESLTKYALQRKEKDKTEGLHLHIISLPKMVTVSLLESQRFLSHHVLPYQQTEQLIYKLALLLQEKEIPQDLISFHLEGIAPFWNNLVEALTTFLKPNEEEKSTKEMTINFIKNLRACE